MSNVDTYLEFSLKSCFLPVVRCVLFNQFWETGVFVFDRIFVYLFIAQLSSGTLSLFAFW